jgi:hypothetical protein
VATADVVTADADLVRPSQQTFIDLGTVLPGRTVTVDVGFVLLCRNSNHAERGTTITLTPGVPVKPVDGTMTATPVTLGPVPADWPADGEACIGDPEFVGSQTSRVVVGAPVSGGQIYTYSMPFDRAPSDGLTGGTSVGFRMTVPANTPPMLELPADLTVEGDTLGGWTASFSALSIDAEDDPDPSPTCSPAPGDVLPLGPTTVACSATDSGGLASSGSFLVTVVDTTAPELLGVPADVTVTATGPSGAVVHYDAPTALDVVDASPDVACAPGSGTTFAVGSTTVTCTAIDDRNNTSSASFDVTVTPPVASTVLEWGEPVDGASPFVVRGSRTIPVKVRIWQAGSPVTSGSVGLWMGPCGGQAARIAEMSHQGHKWAGHLTTSGLGSGCYDVTVRVDGAVAGGFTLHVEGDAAALNAKHRKKG